MTCGGCGKHSVSCMRKCRTHLPISINGCRLCTTPLRGGDRLSKSVSTNVLPLFFSLPRCRNRKPSMNRSLVTSVCLCSLASRHSNSTSLLFMDTGTRFVFASRVPHVFLVPRNIGTDAGCSTISHSDRSRVKNTTSATSTPSHV